MKTRKHGLGTTSIAQSVLDTLWADTVARQVAEDQTGAMFDAMDAVFLAEHGFLAP